MPLTEGLRLCTLLTSLVKHCSTCEMGGTDRPKPEGHADQGLPLSAGCGQPL